MNPLDKIQKVVDLVQSNEAAKTVFDLYDQVYAVGGVIRDAFQDKDPKDIDLVVSGIPREQLESDLKKMGKLHPTKEHANYRFNVGNDHCDISLPKTSVSTGPGHDDYDFGSHHAVPIEADLSRRDFTVNGMAIDLHMAQIDPYNALIDPYSGLEHLDSKTLSLINPNSLRENPLQIVRAIVAFASHDLIPDEYLEEQLKEHGHRIRNLPNERLRLELDKLLSAPDPATAFQIAHHVGLLDYMIPELAIAMDHKQHNKNHDLTTGEHSLMVLRNVAQKSEDKDLRLAALLHDVGKPDSQWIGKDGHGHYFKHKDYPDSQDHEEVGAHMVRDFMDRLGYSKKRIHRVTRLVKDHMFPYFVSPRGARKFMNSVNGDWDHASDLMTLRDADARGKKGGQLEDHDQAHLDIGQVLFNELRSQHNQMGLGSLPVNGQDILNLGVGQGPRVGEILHELLAEYTKDPSLNREDLLTLAQGLV